MDPDIRAGSVSVRFLGKAFERSARYRTMAYETIERDGMLYAEVIWAGTTRAQEPVFFEGTRRRCSSACWRMRPVSSSRRTITIR